jgi:hypothetical protein
MSALPGFANILNHATFLAESGAGAPGLREFFPFIASPLSS